MQWQFWIDRGGTFTDIVAQVPDGSLRSHKLLSENPGQYEDAAIQGIRDLMGLAPDARLPVEDIAQVRLGTTLATNALLERRGEPTAWVTTKGFGDALRIGNQARPELFDLHIQKPHPLHVEVLEIVERVGADGEVLIELDGDRVRSDLAELRARGIQSIAISLVHGYRYPDHERRIANIALELGFQQISTSFEVSPLMKFVPRSQTTLVDAYLSPVLANYVDHFCQQVRGPRVFFMQSGGGLVDAKGFRGKDALLSGPAGGVVGMVQTAGNLGMKRLIGFDMGGTSTDVCHFDGHLERTLDGEVDGVLVRAPMMRVHTVAAGGGSVLSFDGARLRVGPESTGAQPGPVCYGSGKRLAITDCHVLLGRLQPEYFPKVFGPDGSGGLEVEAVRKRFEDMAQEVGAATARTWTAEELASGFLDIAVANMADAIKRISIQRGYDPEGYTLVCFGGAGGQHACRVADQLGMQRVLLHPMAGVLSALGIGLANVRHTQGAPVGQVLTREMWEELQIPIGRLQTQVRQNLATQGIPKDHVLTETMAQVRYLGTETTIEVPAKTHGQLVRDFENAHRKRFGFLDRKRPLEVESISVEGVDGHGFRALDLKAQAGHGRSQGRHPVYVQDQWLEVPFYQRAQLPIGKALAGPAVILEATGTTVVEPGWQASRMQEGSLVLERTRPRASASQIGTQRDPIALELFHNRFREIAQEMGLVLQNTAQSVNIKERLDFSCALFDAQGRLIANAPHIPVHLGSMGESVRAIMAANRGMGPGDAFAMNAPFGGGTHLPDITVVKPVFVGEGSQPDFFVAARGHHADVGGTRPGSAPPDSTHIEEEGVLLENLCLVRAGEFQEQAALEALLGATYPARNPDQNIADLKAQVAACERGSQELARATERYGLEVVRAYMGHVLDNAQESVERIIGELRPGLHVARSDDGHQVQVRVDPDPVRKKVRIDFTGSSPGHPGNWNAPKAIAKACLLYVFRCLVRDPIPLNAGCLRPLEVHIPEPSWIAPHYPAAVFAGNVETSQLIVDALLGALGVAAASQGTMNNFLWGNGQHQYYETICGGAGATPTGPGASGVQTHMTNSRLTDVEVLESRFPVILEEFSLRKGSGGKGAHPGGDGVIRRLRFCADMDASLITGRRKEGPEGQAGGGPGQPGVNLLMLAGEPAETLPGVAQVEVKKGDAIEIQTPGGGGYGG